MERIYRDSLKEIKISDEKIKDIVLSVFEEKFKYMSKSNYLRWLNRRNISQRIKDITVRAMSEDDIKKHPNWLAYYTRNTNRVTYREDNVSNSSTWDHEFNHFLTDKVRCFNTFIDEGITEFLSENIYEKDEKTYITNVKYVKLLYKLFGDELIKAYITGDNSFFEKFEKYLGMNLDEYDKSMKAVHNYLYSSNNSQTNKEFEKKEIDKFKKSTLSLITNVLKEQMLNFKFYYEGNINFELLKNEILSSISIVTSFTVIKDKDEFIKNCLFEVLSNSFLIAKYSKDDLKKIIAKSVSNGDINLDEFNKLDYKGNPRDNLYEAANIKLNNTNYLVNGFFDLSMFLLDFNTLMNNNKFEITETQKIELLHTMLYKRFNINIDVSFVNDILHKYMDMYSNFAQIRCDNKKTISESKFFDISKFVGQRAYVEKVDNNFYFVKYDFETKQFVRKGIGFSSYSYNKKYPRAISFIDRDKKSSIEYRLLFDEYYESFLYKGEEIKIEDGIESVLEKELLNEISNINYNDYIIYFGEEEYKDFLVIGSIHEIDKRERFIDFKSLLDVIKSRYFIVSEKNKYKLITMCINKCLHCAYGNMIKDDNRIIRECLNYILFNDISAIDRLNNISVGLIEEFKEYQSKLDNRSVIVIDSEEKNKKFKNMQLKKEENEYKSDFKHRCSDYIESNYKRFLIEENEEEVKESDYTFGLFGVSLTFNRAFKWPLAKKIDFELFVESIKQRVKDEPDKYRNFCINNYVDNFCYKVLGCFLSNKFAIKQEIDSLIYEISDMLELSIMNNKKIDDLLLNEKLNRINRIFLSNKGEIKSILKDEKLRFKNPICKQYYDSIIRIINDQNLSEEVKRIKIETLIEQSEYGIVEDKTMIDRINEELQNRQKARNKKL